MNRKVREKTRASRKPIAGRSLLAAITLAAFFPACADAYYYPFSYRGVGNILYPLSYIAYPLLGGAPVSSYTTAGVINRAARGLTGYRYGYGYGLPYMYGPYTMRGYQDDEPLYAPRQRARPKRLGQFGVDETTHATWQDGQDIPQRGTITPPYVVPSTGQGIFPQPGADQQGDFSIPNAAPDAPLLQGGAPQFAPPSEASPSTPQIPPQQLLAHAGQPGTSQSPSQEGMPPLAPRRARGAGAGAAGTASGKSSAGGGAPFAQAFVNHVNERFQGNIEDALFDPQTRSFARVLGLVDGDKLFTTDFSDTRVELVRQVLKDPSLDPVSKINAVKILISSGANRAN